MTAFPPPYPHAPPQPGEHDVTFRLFDTILGGTLLLPEDPRGLAIVFSATSGARHESKLRTFGLGVGGRAFGTLILDLLTVREEARDADTHELRHATALLATRINAVADALVQSGLLRGRPVAHETRVGLCAVGAASSAALAAAAMRPDRAAAVASVCGRPDGLGAELGRARAPTLFLAGTGAPGIVFANERAMAASGAPSKRLVALPDGGDVLADAETCALAAGYVHRWFLRYVALSVFSGGSNGRSGQ